MITRTLACLALAAATGTGTAAADSNVFTLGDIEVTAKRIKEEGTGVQTVTQENIEDHNRETVSRALTMESGVTIANVGPRNESTVYVRGYDLRQVPVYVDGIPIYVPYDGYVDLGRFNTFDLSQIEISKGFTSVLNGPNAFGGAINLLSRRPSKAFEGDVGAGVFMNDDFGDNGYRAYANLGTNQGGWYAQIGASYLDKRQYSLSDEFEGASFIPGGAGRAAQPPGERLNSYNSDQKVNVKLGLTPNATDEYALNLIAQRGEKGVPSYAGNFNASGPTGPRYWQWPYWDKTSAYFLSQTAIGDVSYVKTRVYYDQFENSLNQYTDATYATLRTGGSRPSFYDDYTYGASIEAGTRFIPTNEFKVAAHYKDDVHREHLENGPTQNFEDQIYSIGIEDSQRFGERLTIVAGASYDASETREAQNLVGGNLVPFEMGSSDAFNPQIGAFYKTGDTGIARVTVSRKSRFPTIKDRYSYRLGTALPNPDLEPERVTHYEVGYADSGREHASYNVSAFHDEIRDLIQLVDNAISPGVGQNRNIGKARYRGFELGGAVYPTSNVELGGSYTYLDRDNISTPNIRLTDVPMHKVFAYAQWRFLEKFRFIGSGEYNSDRYSSTNGQRIASEFGVFNAKLAWDVEAAFTVEFGVNNLLDRNYEYIEGFPEEGRNYFANMLYKF
ncbi:MAG TPA: TonB-dependent receptor [Burkholderiales bacterium]|jgi:iron complex outermembrane receptor protein|nr:TonB-dependent receptor [Burkholderiales bacterium]